MKKTGIYTIVKHILEQYPFTRDDDKKLIWLVWEELGYVKNGVMPQWGFYDACSPDYITRARRKVQEKYPHLRGVTWELRHRIAKKYKGTDIYHRDTEGRLP